MPKIFIYIGSLIGILFVFFGILSFFAFQKNNQPQINTVQEEIKEEIQKEEEKEEEKKEEKEIEEKQEESTILKILYFIMMVIFTIIGVIFIVISISGIYSNYGSKDEKKKDIFVADIIIFIFQILIMLCSFLIKGKMVSVTFFTMQIVFACLLFFCTENKSSKNNLK